MSKLLKISSRNIDKKSLQLQLINTLFDYFNFRVQSKIGELKQLHFLKQSRRHIASIKSELIKNTNIYKK